MLKKFGVSVLMLFCFLNVNHAEAQTPQVCDQKSCVEVEVVSKPADLEKGLMYRTGMGTDQGMLFVFNADERHAFWMKNMHFNLDMLWLDHDGRVIYIGRNIPACTNDPCPVYTPEKDSRYVLELNSGYIDSHQWKPGDKLDLKGILNPGK